MTTILLKNIGYLITMDQDLREMRGASILVQDNKIAQIIPGGMDLPSGDRIINCENMLIMPGMINTHHHFYQTLTRAIPAVQNAELFDWLTHLYNIWAKLTPESLASASRVAAAELILSGCTTSVDHFYVFPGGHNQLFDVEMEAVSELGLRFHLCRGSMSLSKKDGGLPPDCVVQKDSQIMDHYETVLKKWHDDSKYSMQRVVLAPCSPFSVTPEIMKLTKELADKRNLTCHTHLAETKDEENFCLEKFGKRPFDLLEELGWIDRNCFFAHSIWLNESEVARLAKSGAGICHCPSSNMRLGSGIAPIVDMLRSGCNVSLAVDGSASNDSSNMLAEARNALLLQRIRYQMAMTVQDVFEIATTGGARVLMRDDIGHLAPEMAADIIGINMDNLSWAGGQSDPKGAMLLCFTPGVDLSIINGKIVVEDSQLLTADTRKLTEEQNRLAKEMLGG